MREDCASILDNLNKVPANFWATYFVNARMWFWRKYCLNLPFTISHGIDFFQNILDCLDGKQWKGDGEYEENFRKFIQHYRKQYEQGV